jgi:translocator protein
VRRTVLTGALTAAAAGAGFVGTRPDSPWYRSIEKPPWEPPAAAFPLVWTPLYGLIAWGTGRAAERAGPDGDARMLALTTADLAANAGWCWAFFAKESPAAGLGVIAVLDVLNVALVREAARHDRVAAAALTPYVVWTGFATALNASIWWRNRAR